MESFPEASWDKFLAPKLNILNSIINVGHTVLEKKKKVISNHPSALQSYHKCDQFISFSFLPVILNSSHFMKLLFKKIGSV